MQKGGRAMRSGSKQLQFRQIQVGTDRGEGGSKIVLSGATEEGTINMRQDNKIV